MKTFGYGVVLTALLLASPVLADADDSYRAKLFERFDLNGDQRLSADEFGRVKYDYQSFADADTDRSGKLDQREFMEAPALLTRSIYLPLD